MKEIVGYFCLVFWISLILVTIATILVCVKRYAEWLYVVLS